jgi:hypothetical protein
MIFGADPNLEATCRFCRSASCDVQTFVKFFGIAGNFLELLMAR